MSGITVPRLATLQTTLMATMLNLKAEGFEVDELTITIQEKCERIDWAAKRHITVDSHGQVKVA